MKFNYEDIIKDRELFERFKSQDIEPKDIASTLEYLKFICEANKIPFFACMAVSDNGEDTEYISNIASPSMLDVELSNDKITPMLLVMAGFKINKMSQTELEDVNMDNEDLQEACFYEED